MTPFLGSFGPTDDTPVNGQTSLRFGALGNAGTLLVAQIVAAALGFVTTAFAARELGLSAFGIAAIVMAFPSLLATIATIKTSQVLVGPASIAYAEGSSVRLLAIVKVGFAADMTAAFAAMLTTLVVLVATGGVPGAHGYVFAGVVFAGSLVMTATAGTAIVVTSTLRRFQQLAMMQIADRGLVALAAIPTLVISPSVESYVLAVAVGQSLAGCVWIGASSRLLGREVGAWARAKRNDVSVALGQLRGLLGWNFVAVALSGVLSQLPIILLGALRSPAQAGLFKIAWTLMSVAGYAEIALSRVAFPALATEYANSPRSSIGAQARTMVLREGLVGAIGVCLFMLAVPVIVPLVFGSEFDEVVGGAEVMIAGVAVGTALFVVMPLVYLEKILSRWVFAYALYVGIVTAIGCVYIDAGFIAFAVPVGIGLALLRVGFGIICDRRLRRLIP